MDLQGVVSLDRVHLNEVSDGDREFERELIATFLEASAPLLAGLAGPDGVRAAHTLKGSSRSIGAQRVATLAEAIEKALRDDQSPDALIAQLGPEMDAIRTNLDEI